MKGKRILAGLIALVMALSLAACQTGTQTQGQGSVPAGSEKKAFPQRKRSIRSP